MIKVLVVDDSIVMRKVIARILEKDQQIQVVGTAVDGRDALEKIESLQPDVMTLDIEMPVMNGIDVLKQVMSKRPMPVIMMSALTKEGADITIEALNLGACDFITKDFSSSSLSAACIESELVGKVKDVVKNKTKYLLKRLDAIKKPVTLNPDKKIKHEILSIGASTGGPPVLQHILSSLPKDFPVPVVIAQHMPKIFTQSFAQRLNALSRLEVKEAEDREVLRAGVVLVAPGDTHISLKRRGRDVFVEFVNGAQFIYRPSVDLLMSTTAEAYESLSIGVILTGMGSDGLAGMKELKSKRGYIIAQNEETCVVYGMPKAVVNANITDAILPVDKIPEEIMRVL
ncbi:MAG: chemotaxis response regulator protein-glutamate methylesterase [Syntrophorhabdaceae bacterium]|nr:chemotaxis response regulator protein-glutamate methylesterase [Syntrophorhabdaceae bacterium]MDD5243360.1 chemotaxis response regulator protein-glutamate methylesterase [Syntrophorhabdaceae bacterium]